MAFKIISFKLILKEYVLIEFKIVSFNEIPQSYLLIKFLYLIIFTTALFLAVEKRNIEIIKLLLTNDELSINYGHILIYFYYI